MIKKIALALTLGGALGLILGAVGVSYDVALGMSPWWFCMLGILLFVSGISYLIFVRDPEDSY